MTLKQDVDELGHEVEKIKKDCRIGQLNGKWSILFRATLSLAAFAITLGTPYVVSFHVKVTNALIKLDKNQALIQLKLESKAGEYSRAEIDLKISELENRILDKISREYPPKWLQQTVESHSTRLTAIESKNE